MGFEEYIKELINPEFTNKHAYKTGGEFAGYYRRRTEKLVRHFRNHLGEDFFRDKTLLDIGCGHGHIGAGFQDLCSEITCSDGRKSNVEQGKKFYPDIEFIVADVENVWPFKYVDILINCGLLYHVGDPNAVIAKCAATCKFMILDCVTENRELNDITVKDEGTHRYDGAVTGAACNVGQGYLEECLKNNGFKFDRPDQKNGACNYDGKTRYDWTGKPSHGARRLWFCEKV